MIELVGNKDNDAKRQLAGKRWHDTLTGAGLKVELSLMELGRGEDSAAYKGYLSISQGGSRMRIPVNGSKQV